MLHPTLAFTRQLYSDAVQEYQLYHNYFNKLPNVETKCGFEIVVKYTPESNASTEEWVTELTELYEKIKLHFSDYKSLDACNEYYAFDNDYKKFIRTSGVGLTFLDHDNEIIIMATRGSTSLNVSIFAAVKNDAYYALIDKVSSLHTLLTFKTYSPQCYLISKEAAGLTLTAYAIKETILDYDNYNDDFIKVSAHIDDKLVNTDKGIILLHGEMGTGKTSYLRRLLSMKNAKKIIYIPPDMTAAITSPEFFKFLEKYCKNSIIIIEDAENVLQTREAGGNSAVSNILNVSDGILGDILNIQFVCTFNSTLDMIDKALRRPGRLIAEYEFKKLTVEKTANLIKKLYNIDYTNNVELSLAEIYGYKETIHATQEKERIFGFKPE